MHKARPYGLAMLFAVIVLWAYWRVALHPRPPGRGARAVLVLGATGLLYAHYFGALLLPALALFHLVFVRKERRWWQPVVLLGLAALLALPQVPDLLSGIAHNQEKDHLNAKALRYPEVIATFLRFLSNGLLEIRRPFSTLLVLALPLPLFIFGWRSRRDRQPPGAAWFLSLTSILLLLLLLGGSEWLLVFERKRVRYLATLWPPVLLLISLALLHPKRALLRPPGGLVLVALLAFLGTSDYLGKGVLVRNWSWRDVPFPIAVMRMIAPEGSASGFLVIDRELIGEGRVYELYTGGYDKRRRWLESGIQLLTNSCGARQTVTWYGWYREVHRKRPCTCLTTLSASDRTAGSTVAPGRIQWSPWNCSSPPCPLPVARLQFESAATLLAPDEVLLRDGRLLFWAGLRSDDETFLNRHSLAIHIIDPRSGVRVAQGDTGVGPGTFVRLRSEIDISALPPGDYEVRVALYDWQTGVAPSARDLETDEVSDMHTLHHFHLD